MTPAEIAAIAGQRAFGGKLITNVFRGLVAEAIVSGVLHQGWRWCSEDYYPYDFVHETGVRLEVKQSAVCQSWMSKKPSATKWDIRSRDGYYEGETWVEQPGRNADIYVLALHPVLDRALVDHRDPGQWMFLVVPATALPDFKTIGLQSALRLATGLVPIDKLHAKIVEAMERLSARGGSAKLGTLE